MCSPAQKLWLIRQVNLTSVTKRTSQYCLSVVQEQSLVANDPAAAEGIES